jgi:hypothetical protein
VVKLVNTGDLKSPALGLAGSSPATRTTYKLKSKYNNYMKTINIKLPTIEDIEFTIEAFDEFEHPNDHFALDTETQDEIVNNILNDFNNGNRWAWCYVRVTGKYKGLSSEDNLGCCSYESEEDFKTCGYYDDMKNTVYNAIIKQLEDLV